MCASAYETKKNPRQRGKRSGGWPASTILPEEPMPTMKLYRNGTSAYMGGTGDHVRAPRGVVTGWTAATARRQTQWLWTVNADALSGQGYAVTLTIRDCPPDAATFHKLRRLWIRRVERMGAVRIHWVIEWTRRGIPHLHAAVYFPQPLTTLQRNWLGVHWMVVAAEFGTGMRGQHVAEISGAMGWLKYLSKHASRGAAHYQRVGHPEGWNKTGRLWGHAGEWPVDEPVVLDGLSNPEFWRLRRLMRGWAVADARKAGDWSRVAYLRRAGRPADRKRSSFQGVSEWIPEDVSLRLVDFFERENR